MPTIKEWTEIHADLMQRLHLPCRLNFSREIAVAQHSFDDDDGCHITINPKVDFRVPEHLILHEAAHHRVCAIYANGDAEIEENVLCHYGWGTGHCEHWSRALCDIYHETKISLPQITSFTEFAKAAGIVHKNYAMEGENE